VCSGTSCLKATRKPAWIEMPPDMVVVLDRNISTLLANAGGRKLYKASSLLLNANKTM
jgi:ABC-type hemin transport system substrate-binding protein